jgi:cobalt/nickel transport system permease protein
MQVTPEGPIASPVSRLDPRVRLGVLLAFAFLTVCLSRWDSLAVAAALSLAALLASGHFDRRVWRRQAGVNTFFLFLLLAIPLSVPGRPVMELGPLRWTAEGLAVAALLGARANIVVLMASALVSDLDPSAVAHALQRLGLPHKLAQALFFCVRYLEVLHQEYHRLRNAMKLRAFRARANHHSLRALGNLVGMLFVRSIDRSERVLEAMKCRGYDGRLYSLASFKAGVRDVLFAGLSLCSLAGLILLEWWT